MGGEQRLSTLFAGIAGLPAVFQQTFGQTLEHGVQGPALVWRTREALVTQQHQVATGLECGHGGLDKAQGATLDLARTSHRQVVTEDGPVEMQLTPQDVLQPTWREARWQRIDFGVDHMGRHHTAEGGAEPPIGQGAVVQHRFEAALVDRDVHMRVGFDKAMAWKVFAAVGHARQQEAIHQAFGQGGCDARVTVEGAVTNDAALAVVKVEHRGEAEVDATRAQFAGQHEATGVGRIHGSQGTAAAMEFTTDGFGIFHPQLA